MKLTLLIVIAFFVVTCSYAQAPQKMSYQAVIRNNSNELLTNQSVGMKISILQGSASGTPVYAETQTSTTNAGGLLSLEIGGGTPISGSFTNIDWSDGPYFLKTETDPSGGTNYTITGTGQLLSVPYALYAKKAENGFSGNFQDLTHKPATISGYGITDFDFTGVTTNDLLKYDGSKWVKFTPDFIKSEVDGSVTNEIQTLTLTDDKLTINGTGGNTVTFSNWDKDWSNDVRIIGDQSIDGNKTFTGTTTVAAPVNASDAATKAYVDSRSPAHSIGESYGGGIVFYVYENGQHGLIAAPVDQITGPYYYGPMRVNGAYSNGVEAGKMNTAILASQQAIDIDELICASNECLNYQITVGGVRYAGWYLPSIHELNLLYAQKNVVGGFSEAIYWSSTEYHYNLAHGLSFATGTQDTYLKSIFYHVRPIKSF